MRFRDFSSSFPFSVINSHSFKVMEEVEQRKAGGEGRGALAQGQHRLSFPHTSSLNLHESQGCRHRHPAHLTEGETEAGAGESLPEATQVSS